MNRVLVVFSDGLLSELDSARGLVSRSAWIRQAVEDKLMKEAVAPLVPEGSWRADFLTDGHKPMTAEEWEAFQEGAGFETPEETEVLDRMHGITPEPETITVKRIRGRKLVEEQVPKPKARRKKAVQVVVTERGVLPEDIQIPARCHCGRGMIIAAGPRKGQCTVCGNPKPLKEPT